MKYIDIHTHHRPEPGVIAIQNILNPDRVGTELEKDGFYSVGIHPWHIHPDHWKEDIDTLRSFIHHEKVLALGEAGLDRLADLPVDIQQEVFEAMVALSEEAKKPLIIHAVRTHAEIIMLHRNLQPKQSWIVHGFNVRKTIADGILNRGIYLSFGKALFMHHSSAVEVLAGMPEEMFFLESDEQQISIAELYNRAAQIRNADPEQMGSNLEDRFKKIFGKINA